MVRGAASANNKDRVAALSLAYFLDSVCRPLRLPAPEVTPDMIWNTTNRETSLLLGLRPREVRMLPGFRSDFSPARAEAELKVRGIKFIARGENGFPDLLRRTCDPPVGLFVLTKLNSSQRLERLLSYPRVAIVGARSASRYGIDAAEMLATGLSRASVCVVSGMALGIDSAAHRGAMGGPGNSIAVLGGGVDVVYPAANRSMHGKLVHIGAVISEYPPGSRPRPWRFPARNRIIAGMSSGVIVVEGREGSGSLITADFCLDQGKEVFAVPGGIFSPLSEGPLRLIREGASAVSCPEHVLEALGFKDTADKTGDSEEMDIKVPAGKPGSSKLSDDEQALLSVLNDRPCSVDELAMLAAMDTNRATVILISMELKGLARYEPGRGYSG